MVYRTSVEGLQDSAAVDGLRQSGQWFNLREIKRISTALCTAFSKEINTLESEKKNLCSLHFICQTTNPI